MPETPEKATAETASPRSSPTKKEIDAATQALNHFAQGKRHLVVGDISSAVNSLQEACKLLADQYGETAPECGDAYFCYGKALLEMARMESGVIGNALDGEEGSTENEEEDSEEGDAESQGGDSQDGEAPEGEDQDDAENKDGTVNKDDDEHKDEGEGEKTEDDEEEVSNLQLAWEMLELAKVIFQKQDEIPRMKTKVADVYLKLGEVGLESENYPQGIEDFKQCLAIQKEVLDSDDRSIAETHYQLGIAYSFCDEFDEAMSSFRSAISVLETRIVNLQKIMKVKADWTEKQRMEDAVNRVDPFYTEQGEIDELNQLLPEMREKVQDMEQMKKDSQQRIKAAKEAMMSGIMGGGGEGEGETSQGSSTQNPFGASTSSSSTIPAKPIMVVRKKQRKLEEDGGGEETKKVKADQGEPLTAVNGSKVANGQTENMRTEESSRSKSSSVAEMKTEEIKKAESKVAS